MIFSLIRPRAPVRINPRASMNMAAMAITAGFEKPERASAGERIPVAIKTAMIPRAVRSMGSLSVTSRKTVRIRIAVMRQIVMVSVTPVASAVFGVDSDLL